MNSLTQSKNIIILPVLIALTLGCVALSLAARAVVPPPGGGYPNQNTAEGEDAVLSLNTPANGTWTATDSMGTARYYHTATLLSNGKVLITGGVNPVYLRSAELYDPATGTWTATGSMGTARRLHTATLLPSGKVLVAGGDDGTNAASSAELYDPATGLWTATDSMSTARASHTATLLPNGKVLVASGTDIDFRSLRSAELYDPATGMWTATGNLVAARGRHTATLLPNGKVLVTGGANGLISAELYDPPSGTWTATGNMGTARFDQTATLLSNGNVLVAAGYNFIDGYLISAELYDPASGTWSATDSLGTARAEHTATLLLSGKVLAAGGVNNGATRIALPDGGFFPLSSAELYISDGAITLSAAKRKVEGINTVRLTWSGASSTKIDIYRDGMPIVRTANHGSYVDSTGDSGRTRYTYQVCEGRTSTCSNTATVSFSH